MNFPMTRVVAMRAQQRQINNIIRERKKKVPTSRRNTLITHICMHLVCVPLIRSAQKYLFYPWACSKSAQHGGEATPKNSSPLSPLRRRLIDLLLFALCRRRVINKHRTLTQT